MAAIETQDFTLISCLCNFERFINHPRSHNGLKQYGAQATVSRREKLLVQRYASCAIPSRSCRYRSSSTSSGCCSSPRCVPPELSCLTEGSMSVAVWCRSIGCRRNSSAIYFYSTRALNVAGSAFSKSRPSAATHRKVSCAAVFQKTGAWLLKSLHSAPR